MKEEFQWHLRRRLAEIGVYKTTELVPLLEEQGVRLSREQVYRLVSSPPQRLNIEVLGALCRILQCTPDYLMTFETPAAAKPKAVVGGVAEGDLSSLRPVAARISRPDRT